MGIFPNNMDVNSVSAFVIDLLTPGADLDWNSRGLGGGPQEKKLKIDATAFVNTEAMRF